MFYYRIILKCEIKSFTWGADVVLTQPYTAEEVSLQSYALIRRYTEWKSERKEEIPVMVGKLKILPLQRTVEWEHKRIPVVKREFDFLYLLATTPGRVYTYSQIYQLVWQEYPHGDITNIIYCMVHRLKQKLKKVDVNAEHIISSVKEVGYCLKVYKESQKAGFWKWSLLFIWRDLVVTVIEKKWQENWQLFDRQLTVWWQIRFVYYFFM